MRGEHGFSIPPAGELLSSVPGSYRIDLQAAHRPQALRGPSDPEWFSAEGFLGWLSMQDGPEYALAGGTRRVLVDDVFSDGSRIFEPGAFTGTWEQFVELGASGWEEFLPWCRCLMELCGGDLSRLKDRLDASGGRVARLIPGGAAEAYRYWMDSEAFAEHCRQQGIDQA